MKEKEEVTNSETNDFLKKESFWVRWFAPLKNKKPRTDKKFFGFMQRLGGTFMLPIAAMVIGGVLLGIGTGIQQYVSENSPGWQFLEFLKIGGTMFTKIMPLVFVIAIVVGLVSNNAGAAAIAAAISYFGTLGGMQFMLKTLDNFAPDLYNTMVSIPGVEESKAGIIKSLFGMDKVMDMSVLGAIISGVIIWQMNEKLQYTKLPMAIAFFGGKRLTPTLSVVIFPVYGAAMCFLWPWVAKGLYYGGLGLQATGNFGPGIHIFISRLFCPTGLHHMINALVAYTPIGGTYTVIDHTTGLPWIDPTTGIVAEGIVGTKLSWMTFMAANEPLPHNLTRWLAGGYSMPIFWGLPAAGIAMWLTAKKDQRPMVRAAVISGILATIFGGITETIEFLFLFVAPLLYLFHSFMIGVAYVVFAYIDIWMVDATDFWGFITWGPIYGLQTKWYLMFALGPVYAAIYFVVFYFSIKKFDLKTLGREDNTAEKGGANAALSILETTDQKNKKDKKKSKADKNAAEQMMAEGSLNSLGGWKNIDQLNNCFTRLRVTLKEPREITDAQVKAYGAIGLKKISDTNYQIIIGAQVETVRNLMEKMKGMENN